MGCRLARLEAFREWRGSIGTPAARYHELYFEDTLALLALRFGSRQPWAKLMVSGIMQCWESLLVDSNDRSKCSGHVNYGFNIPAWYIRRRRFPEPVQTVSDQTMMVSMLGLPGHGMPTEGASETRVMGKKGGGWNRAAVSEDARFKAAMAEEYRNQTLREMARQGGVPEPKPKPPDIAHAPEVARRVGELREIFATAAEKRYTAGAEDESGDEGAVAMQE